MANDKFDKRKAGDDEAMRLWGIESLQKMISEMPAAQRSESKLVVGNQSFTVDELLKEVEEGTEVGKMYLRAQDKLRIEQLRRG